MTEPRCPASRLRQLAVIATPRGPSPRSPKALLATIRRRLFCRQGELKQLSAVQDWQRERLTGVDIASVSDGSPKPLPTEPVDDQRR